MKKHKRQTLSQKIRKQRKELNKRMRLRKVVEGLGINLSVKQIHYKTQISEKNIRKIMLENSEEITFLLLKR